MTKCRQPLALLAVLALLAGACAGQSTSSTITATGDTIAAADPAGPSPAKTTEADSHPKPGDGIELTMARANWSPGYFQAAVYRQLLEELGYSVSDPSKLELSPSTAYLAMAQRDFDFWVNSWYPGHATWLATELPDGTKVGDHVSVVGEEMMAGGLQGYLITKSFADEYGVTHLDQINDDPAILAAFDAGDPLPGNGIADIYGCPESYTCDNVIANQIAFSGWENIHQIVADYDSMVGEAIAKAQAGDPMVIYTWTPSAPITKLIPGTNVYWLAVDEVIDDSNPTNQEGGESSDQRPGTANIGADICPAAADADTCQLGWMAADIQVTANNEFLADNPAAAKLLELVKLPVIDVSLANVEQDSGRNSNDDINALASEWIVKNRDIVDAWINEAAEAGA